MGHSLLQEKWDFTVFDLEQGKQLPLIERPLIANGGKSFREAVHGTRPY